MKLKNITEHWEFYKKFINQEKHIRISNPFLEVLDTISTEIDTPKLIVVNDMKALDSVKRVFKDAITGPDFDNFPFEVNFANKNTIFEKKKFLKDFSNANLAITTVKGLFDYVPTEMLLQELQLKVGDSINIQNFSKTLTEFGFVRMPEVTQKGEFAIKGEIIDAFPFDYEKPVRI